MSSPADGKMVKYLLDKNYIQPINDIFNKIFKDGKDSMSAVSFYKSYTPGDLYTSLKDQGSFREDALTVEQLHSELATVYDKVRAPGENSSNMLKGGRRKSSTRRSKRKARKTRSRR
jgi:hypothetical protein